MERAINGGRPKVISLYTGAGGLDYGFEAAGFDTAVAVELDHECCETLRYSRPQWCLIEGDILATSSTAILDAAGCGPGDVEVLIGGPPCQPFSKSGYWSSGDAKRLEDPRANTLEAYLRVLEDTKPKTFLLENVLGLAFHGKDEGLRYLLHSIERINERANCNYRPCIRVVNAAEYGVPQVRERVFVIASRDGTMFDYPEPTHATEAANDVQLSIATPPKQPFLTAWDAIGDVVPEPTEDLTVRGKWANLLPSIPEGHNYLWHTDRGGGRPLFGWRRRYWSFLLKLAKTRPSWTLQAQPGPAIGPLHWENRYLGMRELCRLQTFPDDVVILGRRAAVQKQVGNAVPSLLGEILAREIRRQLLDGQEWEKLSLQRPRNEPIPQAEPVAAVPAEYLRLEGSHEPHPGTGRGFSASKRREKYDLVSAELVEERPTGNR